MSLLVKAPSFLGRLGWFAGSHGSCSEKAVAVSKDAGFDYFCGGSAMHIYECTISDSDQHMALAGFLERRAGRSIVYSGDVRGSVAQRGAGSESSLQNTQKDETTEGQKTAEMKADIKVKVTVIDGTIADIEIVSQKEDPEYFNDALVVIEYIIEAGN
ncbi:MAG: hypothetical protein IJ716_03030 [Lachnospiraceae bacterium]|nr:hypothetical protein [Lachnospiraceae bacterium]